MSTAFRSMRRREMLVNVAFLCVPVLLGTALIMSFITGNPWYSLFLTVPLLAVMFIVKMNTEGIAHWIVHGRWHDAD